MLSLTSCQQFARLTNSGEPATWHLIDPSAISPTSDQIDIEVTRLGCASGTTGEILEPKVTYEAEQIVIRVDVAPAGAGPQTCQGNDAVPVVVELTEPIGLRSLIDGGCALEGVGTTSECADTAVRFEGK
ncbi:hypothetical protein [Pseudoclavibacter helvolus]|uniref:hypothetical protein n=1 Tax=Pseudoclavibacter helvolus TaxID=255205 RepID=UPI000839A199|nr:hypothetical protein [Pseudoclavibacter helvolus]